MNRRGPIQPQVLGDLRSLTMVTNCLQVMGAHPPTRVSVSWFRTHLFMGRIQPTLGGGNSNIFGIFTPIWGR